MEDVIDDPVVRRLLRAKTGLRAGGAPSAHDVLATYYIDGEKSVFAICRHGLLLCPGERYIPYGDIDNAGYYDRAMVERAKEARINGRSAPLTIRLNSGESVELPLEGRGDAVPDLLTIAKIIHQRVVIARAERGERWVGEGWRAKDAQVPGVASLP